MRSVSVIVPHYNDLAGLDNCLEALLNQSYPRALTNIIVADNNSQISKEEILSLIGGRARLVFVEDQGAGLARNGAIDVSTSEILAFTDSDCVPHKDWLIEGIDALADFDLVGGEMVVLTEYIDFMSPSEAFEVVFAFNNKKYINKGSFSVTANLFCDLALYQCVGPFKSGLSEDKEWCNRAVSKGYSIGYAPKAIVGHPARVNWLEMKKKWRRIDAETYGLSANAFSGKVVWALRSLLVLASIIPHSALVITSKKLKNRHNKIAALKMLIMQRCWRFVNYWALLIHSCNKYKK